MGKNTMILTCPSSGATASACAWENDIIAREAMQAIIALPAPVAKVTLGYLSLFRPTERAPARPFPSLAQLLPMPTK